ncbi:MAG: proton-conducting transporter membrane subunit, partial [Acidimicrobiales bacterium]
MAPDLLLAGLAIWALGAGFDLVLGAGRRWARPVPYLAGTAGSACVLAAGVVAVVGPGATVDLGNLLQLGRTAVRLDHLAGLFLTLTGILGVAVSSCLASWCRPQGRVRGHGQGAGYLLLLGAVSVVVVAGDVFTFLFAWESLSVAFYVLTGVQRRSERGATAAWVTLGASKVSGALLLLGFLLLAGRAGTFTIAAWSGIGDGVLHSVAYALLVAGFAAKVGMAPFQVWIPIGYPAAAGPTRAAMAGLAVNVGFYGLWRILGVLGAPPTWLVAVVLLLGGITALLGIAFAAVQSDLDRVIAYSSVENAGVIMVGYGVAMAGSALSLPSLTAVGLLAATLQVIAHGVAKSALFAAAADVEAARGTSALEGLSGAGRSRPASGVT